MQLLAPFRGKRALPEFLVIGAAKSGTTSLFSYLGQHPGIILPVTKEVNYLSHPGNFLRGENWYRAHFPKRKYLDRLSVRLGYRVLTGEATPSMYINSYAVNASELLPTAKLVVILRNPIDRAYSHYRHQRRTIPSEKMDFWDALQAEPERIAADILANQYEQEKRCRNLRRFGYSYKGKYIDQIEHWLRFFPREQMLIVPFERLEKNPGVLCNNICEFLGLPPYELGDTRPLNIAGEREVMESRCKGYLTEFFRPHNRKLFDFLGEDWGWPS
jgi:Sulfotransferase domain